MQSKYGVGKAGFALAMLLVIIGGINWGIHGFFGKDLLKPILGKRTWIVYVLVGLAAIYIGFARDTYLPFLGPTVMPCSLLKDQVPEGATTRVQIHVQPGAKVLYWAAEPATEDLKTLNDWQKAYLEFKNAGVTTAGSDGLATLLVRTPQPYTVPRKGLLSPHIHYRICVANGVVGRVETVYVENEKPENQEGFAGLEENASLPPSLPTSDTNLQNIAENTERAMFVNDGMNYDSTPNVGADLDSAFTLPM